MPSTKTLTIIKPEAVEKEFIGPILAKINRHGFHISAMKLIRLTTKMAEDFYSVHADKPFFEGLIKHMTSGPVVVAILEKENAVKEFRKLIGNTDPAKAKKGTLRKSYAESTKKNAVHGSDSIENAVRECNFFFSLSERHSSFETRG
jgi:nucleoside-diphosphate kinase